MTESFENYPFDGGEGCLPLIGPCGKEFQHRNFFLIKSDLLDNHQYQARDRWDSDARVHLIYLVVWTVSSYITKNGCVQVIDKVHQVQDW